MKKQKLLFILFPFLCFTLYAQSLPTVKSATMNLSGNKNGATQATYQINISYPILSSSGSDLVEVNQVVHHYVAQIFNQFSTAISNELSQEEALSSLGKTQSQFSLTGDYTVSLNTPNALSFSTHYYLFTNGANGSTLDHTFNFIYQNGAYHLLTFNQFTATEKKMILNDFYQELLAKKIYPPEILNDILHNTYTQNEIFNSFLLTNNGIQFSVTLIQVNGPETLLLPYEEFNSIK